VSGDQPGATAGLDSGSRGELNRTFGPAATHVVWLMLSTVIGRGDDARAVVNGLFGDALAEQGSPLATPMTIRQAGTALAVERAGLARALPDATDHLCVLVHGLMCTESIWGFPDDSTTTYGSLLAVDHGVTPVYVRYNTGSHISTNGQDLAALLDQLVAAWPLPVHDISLIGHSMGGLVLRSACHYAPTHRHRRGWALFRQRWTAKVRRVVLIGTPNTGAPLEMLATVASSMLWSLPIPATRLAALGLDQRSAGIKDLRFGAIVDEDWLEQDPDARHRPTPHDVRPLRRADYLVIAGSLTAQPDNPLARVLGDALVRPASATGQLTPTTDEVASLFPGATSRVFPNTAHLALAADADVYREIDRWWPA
jgi:triacylglycerol lipase